MTHSGSKLLDGANLKMNLNGAGLPAVLLGPARKK
jgi:hypothetical protein